MPGLTDIQDRMKTTVFLIPSIGSHTLLFLQYSIDYTGQPCLVLEGTAEEHYYQEAEIIRVISEVSYRTSYKS
jgi:hypothetical protein